jgi:hypothetical protein
VIAAIVIYIRALLSGGEDLFWPHAVLITGSVLAGIAVGAGIIFEGVEYSAKVHRVAKWLVIGGVAVESTCTVILFAIDEALATSQQAKIIALETEMAPRPWTKDQFDALQTLKGKLRGVGIAWERSCIECMQYATFIQIALHEAGAVIYEDSSFDPGPLATDTGIEIILPAPADLFSDPIVGAFKAAGLNPIVRHPAGEFSIIRTDIPVVVVGERFSRYIQFPYFPNYPSGVGTPYPVLPLRKQ